jgi:acyl carrier protein
MADLRSQVSAKMYEVVAAATNASIADLTDSTELIADLGAKSANLVRIISVLEEEFDLEIPFMQFRRKKSIGEAIEYVVQLAEA